MTLHLEQMAVMVAKLSPSPLVPVLRAEEALVGMIMTKPVIMQKTRGKKRRKINVTIMQRCRQGTRIGDGIPPSIWLVVVNPLSV
jgi:hypothetical protein